MALYDLVMADFPELVIEDFYPENQKIILRDDSDGTGEYIAVWNYDKPLTTKLKKYSRV